MGETPNFSYILLSRNLPVSLWANSGMVALKRSMRLARVQVPRARMVEIDDSKRSSVAALYNGAYLITPIDSNRSISSVSLSV